MRGEGSTSPGLHQIRPAGTESTAQRRNSAAERVRQTKAVPDCRSWNCFRCRSSCCPRRDWSEVGTKPASIDPAPTAVPSRSWLWRHQRDRSASSWAADTTERRPSPNCSAEAEGCAHNSGRRPIRPHSGSRRKRSAREGSWDERYRRPSIRLSRDGSGRVSRTAGAAVK